jgi:hypothetical protein
MEKIEQADQEAFDAINAGKQSLQDYKRQQKDAVVRSVG